jgi:hypothetical protein
MHTYLGEVDDVGSSHSSAGGSKVTLPMFYLEGIVLFPEEKLPLRVLQPRFKAAVVRAMQQEDNEAPYTLGVVISFTVIAISFNLLLRGRKLMIHGFKSHIEKLFLQLAIGLYVQIHVRAKPQDRGIIVASVGTTAEVVAQSLSTCIATFTLCFLQCQELDYSCIV